MSYPITNIISISTGYILGDNYTIDDLKIKVSSLISELGNDGNQIDMQIDSDNLNHCMTHELSARCGSIVIIAGMFNWWHFESSSIFAKRLSLDLKTEVLLTTYVHETNTFKNMAFRNGKEVNE